MGAVGNHGANIPRAVGREKRVEWDGGRKGRRGVRAASFSLPTAYCLLPTADCSQSVLSLAKPRVIPCIGITP
jgi:hypothetical protein